MYGQLKNVDYNATADACLLGISECLDFINHACTVLLQILEMYGITSTQLQWSPDFFRWRKHVAKFH